MFMAPFYSGSKSLDKIWRDVYTIEKVVNETLPNFDQI